MRMGATAESLVGAAASWPPLSEVGATAESLVGAATSWPPLREVEVDS